MIDDVSRKFRKLYLRAVYELSRKIMLPRVEKVKEVVKPLFPCSAVYDSSHFGSCLIYIVCDGFIFSIVGFDEIGNDLNDCAIICTVPTIDNSIERVPDPKYADLETSMEEIDFPGKCFEDVLIELESKLQILKSRLNEVKNKKVDGVVL